MFKLFFALVAVTTMVSMSLIGKMGKIETVGTGTELAPMLIHSNGTVTFPDRLPSPETVYEIRRLIKVEDVEQLNAILVKNNLFVAPTK